MRFVFRADASREIGAGHVMRSSVLAEEAISRGIECISIGEISDLDWVAKRILNLGFARVLTSDESFIADGNSDILILDSYTIPVSDPFVASTNWKFVMCIRDQISPNYESDIELRPGFGVVHSEQRGPRILSGADHILIRKGIEKTKRNKPPGEVMKVLVVGGGSDSFGFVTAMAEVINSVDLNLEVHAFTNGAVPKSSKVQFVKHQIGSEFDSIANAVDVVFTTASTSSLEFIAREIPTGVVCTVDNQVDYYEQLGQLGYASQLGIRNSRGNWEFNLTTIKELLESQEKRDSLKEATYALIDLKGAARVIDTLVSLS
jgi:spore coat polysaccharide biosynthesis predicted glycosyltransferase SpsG